MKNGEFAYHLIDQLILQGSNHFCIAPGSRNTPLSLAVARHPKAQLTVHFDERGLGFFALGQAIASHKPSVLICTSGTAVGNFLPCVMEAHESRVPLIVLSADRPPDQREVGSNQTTNHTHIFNNFVRWQAELPCPTEGISAAFIRSQAAHAALMAKTGPVHLNCPFKDPLYEPSAIYPSAEPQQFFSSSAPFDLTELLQNVNRGVILIGRMPFGANLTNIFALAQQLKWPILADVLSQARGKAALIDHFNYLIRSNSAPKPELVLHFGERFVSKFLHEWMKETPTIHVAPHLARCDTASNRPTRIFADPKQIVCTLKRQDSSWLTHWQTLNQQMQTALEEAFAEPHPFTEADLMRSLQDKLPDETPLFLGTSMPIRDGEQFCFPKKPGPFFGNRGVSGIDGLLATSCGIATTLQRPFVSVLGDQSCLHDLNSFALLKTIKTPFLLVLSNNFGGGIFSHLPVAQDEHFEKLWGVGHSLTFEKAAQMFDIPYRATSDQNFGELFQQEGAQILEVFTSRKENACFQKGLLQKCCTCSATSSQKVPASRSFSSTVS